MKKSIILLFLFTFILAGCSASDLRVLESKELGISLMMPNSLGSCEEKVETKNNEKTSIEGFIANGSTVDVVCGDYDLVIEARSLDHNCYEFCEQNKYPKIEEGDYALYKHNDLDVVVDASYWGFDGEHFYIGSYYPLKNEKYDTFRISMKLADVTFPGMVELGSINPNVNIVDYYEFIDEKLQDIATGNSTRDINKKVKEFESILDSITIVPGQ